MLQQSEFYKQDAMFPWPVVNHSNKVWYYFENGQK